MINLGKTSKEITQHVFYELLNTAEFDKRVSTLPVSKKKLFWLRSPLEALSVGATEVVFPAFQLDGRVNHYLLWRVRELYTISKLPEALVWDFLRTRHKLLNGMTGVDFLLGHFSREITELAPRERDEHFIDLVQEEIWRLLQ